MDLIGKNMVSNFLPLFHQNGSMLSLWTPLSPISILIKASNLGLVLVHMHGFRLGVSRTIMDTWESSMPPLFSVSKNTNNL